MMEKSNRETPQCYCFKCPAHQTKSPDERLRKSSQPMHLNTRTTSPMHSNDNRTAQAVSENSEPEYLLEEIHRPAESVPVKWCENRLADRMEECERCPRPCAGMYRMTLGGINQIQRRRKGRPSSPSSSSCNAEGQTTSIAVRTGRPHTPFQFNDDYQVSKQENESYRSPQKRQHKQTQTGSTMTSVSGRGLSRADRPAFTGLDVACQTNIRSLMSPRDDSAEYPGRDRKGKTCEATNCTDTSNHLREMKNKNSCHRDGSCVRQFAVFTLMVGVIGYLAINHQKYLNRQ
ncbi:hypothetical protein AALO_G00027420 [Alosa alosa]|uniref:Uncharacterized protein n=1 Tax=Alosa alosa TaxID=278164 RepID=A0AAV6HBB5_9TELE|nr:uncharacterized protein LOC125290761 isoform X2 [Alosa alosa]KAG5284503.1 hypothetical protein AALO_G00027420 [Alosa alosa]